ncbi:hypothetical protein PoB_006510300 [Plakobranchus ocellatus]|uniref:Uncharacterized protein n=1 Tax=Plakobranchus ocellatus TaxID=259542 RepID=A0AAV4D3A2_9GAST|nr:hypothetical protein PoB_006510300 [Plakobranchus ocellatus]
MESEALRPWPENSSCPDRCLGFLVFSLLPIAWTRRLLDFGQEIRVDLVYLQHSRSSSCSTKDENQAMRGDMFAKSGSRQGRLDSPRSFSDCYFLPGTLCKNLEKGARSFFNLQDNKGSFSGWTIGICWKTEQVCSVEVDLSQNASQNAPQ